MPTVRCGTTMKPVNVAALAQTIDVAIRQNYLLRRVSVVGRVVSRQTSIRGHVFFALSDLEENIQISGILFQSRRRLYDAILVEGEQVVINGNVSFYAPNGTIRLLAEQITPFGQSLYARRHEELRRQMEAKGYFSPARKRPLAPYVFSVALITSPVGAVVHDVTKRIHERSPFVSCRLFPARVQGEGAPESIVVGIAAANALPQPPDVIIVARGGGSREELATFDSELIIEAAIRSAVPVISAIGHESDSPLLDLAADIRAATPTHAAEIVTQSTLAAVSELSRRYDALGSALTVRHAAAARQLRFLQARGITRSFKQIWAQEKRRLDTCRIHLASAWREQIQVARQQLTGRNEALQLASPETMFRNGYMWVARQHRQITDLSHLIVGDEVQLEDRCHTANALITEITPRKDEQG